MKKNRLFFTEQFLQYRPAFFSFIRPVEADLMYKNRSLLGKKILDFGCGDGFFASLIFNKKEISVGLDVENSRIEESKTIAIYKTHKKYDGDIIPYKTANFSGVFSNSVLEHVPSLQKNVSEIYRVLKKNGYFLTTVMTNKWEEHLFGSTVFGNKYTDWMREKQDHLNLLTHKEWSNIFFDAGFTIVSTEGYLDKKTVHTMELWHYLSVTSIITKKLFNSWVVWKKWYSILNVHKKIEAINASSITAQDSEAASLFFILQKK